MKTMISISAVLLLAAVASANPPEIPATPAGVDEVVYARAFTLEKGYKFEWRKDRPLLTEGTILILKVNPDLVYARQIAEPVLYVGDTTAERVNIGYGSGRVIAIVFGYACHATVLSLRRISGDYAGFAQTSLETRNPGAVALFFTRSLVWEDVEKKVPWGIILLYGGAVTLGINLQATGADPGLPQGPGHGLIVRGSRVRGLSQ